MIKQIFVALLSLHIHICSATLSCGCVVFGDAVDCGGGTSLSGSSCVWYPDANQLFIDGIHCRASEWANCLQPNSGCVPAVNHPSGSSSVPGSVPGAGSIPTGCLPDYSGTKVSVTNAVSVGPASVGADIDAKNNPNGGCTTNSNDCWVVSGKSGHNYATHSVTYGGVTYDTVKGCCYQYKSKYANNPDCNMKTPTQSHLVFEMDCDSSYWSLDSSNAGYVTFGVDGSTCYEGIKLDIGCSNECDYELCVHYDDTIVPNGVCNVKNGWVQVKAGPTFAFSALDGIPTCAQPANTIFSLEFWAQTINNLSETYVGPILVLLVVFAGLYYYFYAQNKEDKYLPLNDESSPLIL